MLFMRETGGVAFFLAILLAASMIFTPVRAATGIKGAENAVERMNRALLEDMKRAEVLGFHGRYRVLEPVISDVFALPFMAEKSLGRYWDSLTPDQRKEYLRVYADWTISTYAGRFNGWSGEKFELESGTEVDGETVAVTSRLVKPDNETVTFLYLLRMIRGKWRIVDIRISGVSQLALTRAQFVSVMKDKGFNGLIAILEEKIATLSRL